MRMAVRKMFVQPFCELRFYQFKCKVPHYRRIFAAPAVRHYLLVALVLLRPSVKFC